MLKYLFKNISFGFDFWITVFSFSFIFRYFLINKEEILSVSLNNNQYILLLLSLIFTILSVFANALAWSELFNSLEIKVERRKLISIHINSNLKKYIPGNIWHFIDRIRILKKEINPSKILYPIAIEPILMLASSLIFVPIYNFSFYKLVFFIPVIFISNKINNKLINFLKTSLLKKIFKIVPSIDKNLFSITENQYKQKILIKPFLIENLFVILRFIGFYICFKTFINSDIEIYQILSCFTFAWVAGLVIPGAPGGVGVFESLILILFNRQDINAELLIVLLFYRFLATLADVVSPIIIQLSKKLINIKVS